MHGRQQVTRFYVNVLLAFNARSDIGKSRIDVINSSCKSFGLKHGGKAAGGKLLYLSVALQFFKRSENSRIGGVVLRPNLPRDLFKIIGAARIVVEQTKYFFVNSIFLLLLF